MFNINLLAVNMDTAVWLQYAFAAMAKNPVPALVIIITVGAAMFFLMGKLWGMAWNKGWNLAGSRGIGVFIAALIGAVSLAGADALYGSNFFNFKTAGDIRAAVGLNPVEWVEDAPGATKIVENLTEWRNAGVPASEREAISITQDFADSYSSALLVFWTIFVLAVLSLFISVAFAAFKDIKEVKPLV